MNEVEARLRVVREGKTSTIYRIEMYVGAAVLVLIRWDDAAPDTRKIIVSALPDLIEHIPGSFMEIEIQREVALMDGELDGLLSPAEDTMHQPIEEEVEDSE